MKVEIAKHSGCCFGVKRAINIVSETANVEGSVKTYGPIIHNPQVVEKLRLDGVEVLSSLDEIRDIDTVIVRSHGATREDIIEIESRSSKLIDATCPFVLTAQKEAERLSNDVDLLIIYGEKDHPEVLSIVSYVSSEYKIISDIAGIDDIEYGKHYGLMSQTTQNKDLFRDLSFELGKKCDRLDVSDTICSATQNRQEDALDLASRADIVIVVGGKNSANTRRLYEICSQLCIRTQHIEIPEELDLSLLKENDLIGLTAGASTPNEFVYAVRDRIYSSFGISD